MNQFDLFSGIGGFPLAGVAAGYTPTAFVEIDPYCQLVLGKNFPGAPVFKNVKTFIDDYGSGKPCHILTGGFPCQPFSNAGERRGVDDDRHLWPYMFGSVRHFRPLVVVGENVAGLLSMGKWSVLAGIINDLESEGYFTEVFCIPASSLGAPHQRDRVWIVGYESDDSRWAEFFDGDGGEWIAANDNLVKFNGYGSAWGRWDEHSNEIGTAPDTKGGAGYIPLQADAQRGKTESGYALWKNTGATADPCGERLARRKRAGSPLEESGTPRPTAQCDQNASDAGSGGWIQAHPQLRLPWRQQYINQGNIWDRHWLEVATELCRVDDGLSEGLDDVGLLPTETPHKKKKTSAGRQHRLEALGNAIVPAVVLEVYKAINQMIFDKYIKHKEAK